MKKSETAQILTMISAMYKNFEINTLKIDLWHDLIGDLDFKLAQIALKKIMLTSEYPPNVAEIRKASTEITCKEEFDKGKAWGEVTRAIKKCGCYEPEEAYKLMSPLTKQIVTQIGFREICMSENIGVERGQFLKMYDTMEIREKENKLLPQAFKDQIENLSQNYKIENFKKDNI